MTTILMIACIVTKAGTYQSCERPVQYQTVLECVDAMKARDKELAEAGFFSVVVCKSP